MKWLFKSSFFSFLKSRGSLIILIIVVFFSTAAYTLVSSSGDAFNKSYNTLMADSRVHDFVAKEKYDLNGDLKFTEGPDVHTKSYVPIPNGWKIDEDMKYMYFIDDNKGTESQLGDAIVLNDNGKKSIMPMRISLDNLDIAQDDASGFVTGVSARGPIQIEVPLHPSFGYVKDKDGNNIGYQQGAQKIHHPAQYKTTYTWTYNGATKDSSSNKDSPFGNSGFLGWGGPKGSVTKTTVDKSVITSPAHDSDPNYLGKYQSTWHIDSPIYDLKKPQMQGKWIRPGSSASQYLDMSIAYGNSSKESFLMLGDTYGHNADIRQAGTDRASLLQYLFTDVSKSKVNKDIVWVAPKNLIISSALQVGTTLANPNQVGDRASIESKVDYAGFLKTIANTMNDQHYLSKGDVVEKTISVDRTNSTGIFNLLLNPVPGNSKSNTGDTARAMIDRRINELGFNKPFVISGKGIDSSKRAGFLADKKTLVSSYIKRFAEENKRNDYLANLKAKYDKYVDVKYTKSISVSDKDNLFKLVDAVDQNQTINKLHIYDGFDMPRKYSDDELNAMMALKVDMSDGIKDGVPDMHKATTLFSGDGFEKLKVTNEVPDVNKDRGFKWVASWNQATKLASGIGAGVQAAAHTIPQNAVITDPSAFFAYVSPSYFRNNDLVPLNPEDIYNNKQDMLDLQLNPEKVFAKYEKTHQVVQVGMVKYFVLGSAVQPDFAFPIINGANPVPNTKSQAIISTSSFGYDRGLDAYRANESENYFSFKFRDDVPKSKHDAIMDDIELFSRGYMSWPSDIRIVSGADDISETVLLAPQRVATLDRLKSSVSTVSSLVSAMLIIFAAFVIILVVKRQVSSRRKNYGILLANGYSKWQIAFSNISLPLITVLIPAIFGYLVGHFTQFAMISVFSDQWTLPIVQDAFSWQALVVVVGYPMAVSSILIFIIVMWELRGRLLDVMQDTPNKFSSGLSTTVLKAFSWMGIKSKIAISLFTTNLAKMVLIVVALIMSITTMTLGFTMSGKFDYAKNASEDAQKYQFKVDLKSPTDEGGMFTKLNPNQIGGDWTQSVDDIMNNIMNENNSGQAKSSHFHIPSSNDENYSQGNAKYLKNKIETQSLLDVSFSGTIPWDVARKTIPEGQNNDSIRQTKKFFQFGLSLANKNDAIGKQVKAVLDNVKNSPAYDWAYKDTGSGKQLITGTPDPEKLGFTDKGSLPKNEPGWKNVKVWHESTQAYETPVQTDAFIVPTYKKFFALTFKHIVDNYASEKDNLPYMISYNNLISDSSDQTYTRVDGQIELSSLLTNENKIQSVSIVGLNDANPDKMIKMTKKNLDSLKNYKSKVVNGVTVYPVVTNSYFNKVYGKKVGDIIDIKAKNMADRTYKLAISQDPTEDVKFEIVGTSESYNGIKLYTLQSRANKILGYDKFSSKNPFNGIFSVENDPTVFQQLTLYSESGFYPSTDSITPGSDSEITMNKMITDNHGVYPGNPGIKNISDYYRVYSKSPYAMVWSNPDWAKMSDYAFESILHLSSSIILLIEIVGIVIAILFIAIVTMMMIDDNKKFISTLKVLGYRANEITRIFARVFIPLLLISIIISVPLIFGLISAIQLLIIGFGTVFIPVAMTGWEVIITAVILLGLVSLIYWSSARQLKGQAALQAFSDE